MKIAPEVEDHSLLINSLMSFVGGGTDCSVGGNAVAQFNKHTQQDRSLQRQTNTAFSPQQNAFKSEASMNQADRQNMDNFMNQNAFQFQPMHHEITRIHLAQSQSVPAQQISKSEWSSEFSKFGSPQLSSPSPINANLTNKQWSNEFQNAPMASSPALANQPVNNMSMRMPYRPMMMNSMNSLQQPLQRQNQEVPQAQAVNWDDQFKEIEQQEEEIQREASPEIVVDDKYQATFQEVWDSLNSEQLENDLISQQYEDFKNTQRETLPADLSQWERDFAKYASTRAHFGDYRFEEKSDNQFLDLPADQDPYEIGLQLMENGAKLSEAALAFEAAIQRDQNHVDAWLKLGEVQTQNEKEIAGISALEKCLELSPENSQALMTLAISYINEGYDNAAFATLERWISTKYPQITDKARQQNPQITDEDRFSLNKRVTELFLKAAQLSPNQANMDPDVQLGLGVLFYANEDFDKTIDCFKAALTIKPDDPVMWNRLGASLANSNRSEEAVDAYFKALELKPTFVRARYNLGVSCINIGCYKEAAEHLLSGLSMHQVEGHESDSLSHNQSTALTETLKRAFIAMERRDLLELVKPGMDLSQFRGEFNF